MRRIVRTYMTRSITLALCLLLVVASLRPAQLSAQTPSDLAGTWALNRQLSQFPSGAGFSADFLGALLDRVLVRSVVAGAAGPGGGRRGRRRRWRRRDWRRLGAPKIVRVTEEDSQRVSLLTDEVRNPFERVTIAETPTDGDDYARPRARRETFHPNGKDEESPSAGSWRR